MYLHLGQDTVITLGELVGIFDLDTTTVSKVTRDFLTFAQRDGRVVTVGTELPKSFVICEQDASENIYISPLSSATLQKRASETGRY